MAKDPHEQTDSAPHGDTNVSEPQKAIAGIAAIAVNIDGHPFENDTVVISVEDKNKKPVKIKKSAGETGVEELTYDLVNGNLKTAFLTEGGQGVDGEKAGGKLTITIRPK